MVLQPCVNLAESHPLAAECCSVFLSALPISVMFVAFNRTPIKFGRNSSTQKSTTHTFRSANFTFLTTILNHGHSTAPSRAALTTANGSYAAATRYGSCKTRDDASAIPSNATPGTRIPSAERRPNIPAIHRKATITGSREP